MPTSSPIGSASLHGISESSSDLLARARACYERHQWNDAFEALTLADRLAPLGAEDLQRLVWSAGLTARDEEMLAASERAYHLWLEAKEDLLAARAAFWLGFRLLARGDTGRASGWLSRAQRLVESYASDCVEQGYLLLPAAQRHLNMGAHAEAYECAGRAAQIGERFGEADLVAFARNLQGRALLSQGRIDDGIALMDEAMVGAAGVSSPPSSRASSTAPLSQAVTASSRSIACGNGPTRSRAGAMRIRSSVCSPGTVWCTEPRSWR
jgi:tetratricopeptide (TPR) repeat protein